MGFGLPPARGGAHRVSSLGVLAILTPRLTSLWESPKALLGTHILGSRAFSPMHTREPRAPGPWQTLPLSPSQTLESSILGLGQEKGLNVQDPAQDSQPTCLPARIREIVTRNFSQPENPGTIPFPPPPPQTLLASHLFSHPPPQ